MARKISRYSKEEKDRLWSIYQSIVQEQGDLKADTLYDLLEVRFNFMQELQRPACSLKKQLKKLIAEERRCSRTPQELRDWLNEPSV